MPKGAGRPAKKAGKRPGKPKPAPTAQELYVQAQIALQYDDCDSALSALRQAAQLEPRNLEVVEAYGSLLAEMGDEEQAITLLRRAVELSPDAGHEKYMYLGQLLEEEEALDMMRRGVALLQEQVDAAVGRGAGGSKQPGGSEAGPSLPSAQQGPAGRAQGQKQQQAEEAMEEEEQEDDGEEEDEDGEPSVAELQSQLCSALCSLAEALMGQAEDVDSVASEVEGLLTRAQAACSSSPEPGQALASLRYEQQRPAEALEVLRESIKRWFHRRGEEEDEEDEEGDGDEEMAGSSGARAKQRNGDAAGDSGDELGDAAARRQRNNGNVEAHASGSQRGAEDEDEAMQPSYEFRFECAKLLLELDDSTDDAIQVLEDLVEEDDSNPHTWHLLGMAYYGGDMLDEAQEIHDKGLKLLKKLRVPSDDELYDDYADLQEAIQHARTVAQG